MEILRIIVKTLYGLVLQMEKKKSGYMVTVHPNTDSAFIVALIVILDDINHFDPLSKSMFKSARMLYDPLDVSGNAAGTALTLLGHHLDFLSYITN